QVTTLAGSCSWGEFALRLPDFARDWCTRRLRSRRLDRSYEAFPVAQRHSKLFEIVFGQLRQHIKVDSVLDELGFVLSESQVSQPLTNVHWTASTPVPDAGSARYRCHQKTIGDMDEA